MRDHSRRRFCRRCERPRDEAGGELFSWRGLCRQCGISKQEAQHEHAATQVSDADWLHRWRRGMAAAAGAQLREDVKSDA